MTSVRSSDFGEWPAAGLERVGACPLCGGSARSTLHEGLQDHAFRAAPGRWTLRQCNACGCAYLDPRPDAATISLAYERYYTHESGAGDSLLARLRRGIQDAYLNDRYGTSYPLALSGGQYLARLVPMIRRYLDVSFARHLGPPTGERARLLDVGCGNGTFLQLAARLGWEAEGIDSDAAAVDAAHAAGCSVTHGRLDDLPMRAGCYQHVTLSHVVEHVHDPLGLLRRCHELLAPGGRLWLETPNLRSFGHDVFGPAWRGLEPPRHLVLFDRRTLTAALAGAGFEGIEFREHPGVSLFMWEQSRMIARASGAGVRGVWRKLLATPPGVLVAEAYAAYRPERSEFLTCIAFRSGRKSQART